MTQPHIITVSGPSLSGKTEFTKLLQKEYNFDVITSVTTRPIRGQEKNGIDYHFITEDEYSKLTMVQKTQFNGFNYGVSESEVLTKKNKPLLWVIAPKSISQVEEYCKQNNWKLTKVFISNPEEVIFERLFTRFKQDEVASPQVYAKRLKAMLSEELQWINEAKNTNLYDTLILKFDETNTEEVLKNFSNQILKTVNHTKKKM